MIDNVDCIKLLCLYDQHVGRVNYAHQTPLGVANFHSSINSVAFLEKHYVYLEDDVVRDKSGDLWWDRELDQKTDDWRVVVKPSGERLHINDVTGETSITAPGISSTEVAAFSKEASKPIRRKIVLVDEDNSNTMHAYKLEYRDMEADISAMAKIYRAATVINKYARRKCAYIALRNGKKRNKISRIMVRFMKEYHPLFKARMQRRKEKGVIMFQGCVRGLQHRMKYFLPGGEQFTRWIQRTKRDLARAVWRQWRRYKIRKSLRMKTIVANMPRTLAAWDELIASVRQPNRVLGIFEEYIYPGTVDVRLYRNRFHRHDII